MIKINVYIFFSHKNSGIHPFRVIKIKIYAENAFYIKKISQSIINHHIKMSNVVFQYTFHKYLENVFFFGCHDFSLLFSLFFDSGGVIYCGML